MSEFWAEQCVLTPISNNPPKKLPLICHAQHLTQLTKAK